MCGHTVQRAFSHRGKMVRDNNMRVLVIEDETVLAEGLRRGLEAEGFATDVAHTGPDGLWMAREHPYDAIVLDLLLPGMNGYKVCAELRDAGVWTPILMLTAKDGEFDEAEALDTGADDYVTKPFSFVVLVARLRALMRRGRSRAPGRPRRRPACSIPRERRAWRGDVGADAHPASWRARIPDAARRRGGVQDARCSTTCGTPVRGRPEHRRGLRGHLRRRSNGPFGRQAIETVRGAGYRLATDGG